MTTQCNGHQVYATRTAAEKDMAALIKHAKQSGQGGKSWKRLNVFPCGNHFHVGRANKLPKNCAPPAPKEKLLTFGQAIRKLKALDEKYERMQDHFNRKRAELIGKIIEADRQAGWFN
jgi:hypothetical protein